MTKPSNAVDELRASDPHDDGESEGVQRWMDGSIERLLTVWARCGDRYARRLSDFDHPGDPLDDLLTLAARRVVPLPAPRRRGLPREGLSAAALAMCHLTRPDRRVLRGALAGAELTGPQLDHSAAAMWRLMERVRAARRRHDGPPAGVLGDGSEKSTGLS